MKFIILPILKFAWAIVLTLIATSFYILCGGMVFIWEFNLRAEDFKYSTYDVGGVSPYWKRNPNYFGAYTFKTMYHYIWGIGCEK